MESGVCRKIPTCTRRAAHSGHAARDSLADKWLQQNVHIHITVTAQMATHKYTTLINTTLIAYRMAPGPSILA